MITSQKASFAAHKPTFVEVDGEIMPSYDGPNHPRYPFPNETDPQDMPHDIADIGATAVEQLGYEIPPSVRALIDESRANRPIPNSAVNAVPKYIDGRNRVLG